MKRITRLLEGEASADHVAPGFHVAVAGGELDGAMKVIVARAPAAAQLHVLAVDLEMRMHFNRTVVGVVTADHHAPAVAHHVETLGNGLRRTARFDDDVHTTTARLL